MSLVKKYQQGGTFSANGKNLSKNDLIYLMKKNWDTYKDNYNLTGEDSSKYDEAFNDILSKIDSGSINASNQYGQLKDFTNNSENSSDQYRGSVAQFMNLLTSQMVAYHDPNKVKYSKLDGLDKYINNGYFGGNFSSSASDLELWNNLDKDDLTKRTRRMSTMADYLSKMRDDLQGKDVDYTGSRYKDKNDHLTRISQAIDLLRKGEYTDDVIRSLMDVGNMSSDQVKQWFSDGKDTTQNQEEKPESEQKIEEQKREEAIKARTEELVSLGLSENVARAVAEKEYDKLKAQADAEGKKYLDDSAFDEYLENYKKQFENIKATGLGTPKDYKYKGESDDPTNIKLYNLDIWNKYGKYLKNANSGKLLDIYSKSNDVEKGKIRQMLLAQAIAAYNNKETEVMKSLGDHKYLLKGYTYLKDGYGWIYDASDPNNPTLYKAPLSDIDGYSDLFRQYWEKNIYQPTYQKQGGQLNYIPKYANGGLTGEEAILYLYNTNVAKNQYRRNKLIKESGKTELLFDHDTRKIKNAPNYILSEKGLDGSNAVRLGAAIADLGGAVASFVPGGSAISLIQGIGSNLARAGADYSDGASLGDIFKNLGSGLAMTAMGAVPLVGSAGKVGKAWKTIKTFVPWALNLYSMYNNGEEAVKSYKNIEAGKGTVLDYTNMLTMFTSVMNTSKLTANSFKAKAIKNAARTGNEKIIVSGKKGLIELKDSELQKLLTFKSKGEMNSYIKSLGINDELNFNHLNKFNPLSGSLRADGKHYWNRSVGMSRQEDFDINLVNPKFRQDANLMSFTGFKIPTFIKFGYNASIPGATTTHTPFNPIRPTPTVVSAPSSTPTAAPTAAPTSTAAPTAAPTSTAAPTAAPTSTAAPSPTPTAVPTSKNGGKLLAIINKYKKGGIVKLLGGGTNPKPFDLALKSGNLYDKITFDFNKRMANVYDKTNNKWSFSERKEGAKDTIAPGNRYYDPEESLNADKMIERENQLSNFYNLLTTNANYAENWARKYKELNNSVSPDVYKDWFDADGKFNHDAFKRSTLWSDHKNGIGHDLYGGKTYYIDGKDDEFYNEDDFNKLKEQGYEIVSDDNNPEYDETGLVRKYKLKKASLIDPTENKLKLNDFLDLSKTDYSKIAANALEAVNLKETLNTNKENLDLEKQKQAILKSPTTDVALNVDIYNTLAQGNRRAGLQYNAGKNIANSTSDSRLAAMARLQSAKEAEGFKENANNVVNQLLLKYADLAVAVANNNNRSITETGNYNNAALISKRNADITAEQNKLFMDTNNKNAYRSKFIKDLLEKSAEKEAYENMAKDQQLAGLEATNKEIVKRNLQDNREYIELQTKYKQALDDKDETNAALYKAQMNKMYSEAMIELQNQNTKNTSKRYGVEFSGYSLPRTYSLSTGTGIASKKKGGTLWDNIQKAREKDNERFDKNRREQIKLNLKAVDSASSLSKEVILKLLSKF